jgi:NAD(P)-dependent dehydrogenase (short-subunit alcohol dehydrogenase family)
LDAWQAGLYQIEKNVVWDYHRPHGGSGLDTQLTGKTFVLTGATSGIGLAAAQILAERGATLIGVGRSAERCAQAESRLRSAHPQAQVHYLVADLSEQAQIRRLAAGIRTSLAERQLHFLDGLINSAGTFTFRKKLTPEGFEMQWAVNHLAHFLLTHELLSLLQAAPAGRVVTVSSGSHYHTRLRWHDIQLKRGYFCLLAYQQTKLCNVLFTAELNRQLGNTSTMQVFAADPGLVNTEMGFKGNPALVRWIWSIRRRSGVPAEQSARGVVYLATEPSIQNSPEIYWKDGHPKDPNPYALDEEAAKRLWRLSEGMCGIEPGKYVR